MVTCMSDSDEHVLAGFRPFGPRRTRALCSCGFETRPVEDAADEARVDAARRLLLTEHGARDPRPGEAVGVPYIGGSRPVRPGTTRAAAPPCPDPREEPRRLP